MKRLTKVQLAALDLIIAKKQESEDFITQIAIVDTNASQVVNDVETLLEDVMRVTFIGPIVDVVGGDSELSSLEGTGMNNISLQDLLRLRKAITGTSS